MNDGVFFVVEPIFWHNPFSFEYFIIAIICSIILYLLFGVIENFCKKKNISVTPPKKQTFTLPDISDENFLKNIFIVLQNFVKEKYLPKNTPAHTYQDIAKYCNNEKIREIYKELEIIIFQKKELTTEQKIFFKNSISEIINQKSL